MENLTKTGLVEETEISLVCQPELQLLRDETDSNPDCLPEAASKESNHRLSNGTQLAEEPVAQPIPNKASETASIVQAEEVEKTIEHAAKRADNPSENDDWSPHGAALSRYSSTMAAEPTFLFAPIDQSRDRGIQTFNFIYFSFAAICAYELWNVYYPETNLFLLPIWIFFALVAALAAFFRFKDRAHPHDFAVVLNPIMRKSMRFIALLLPLPIILFATMRLPGDTSYYAALSYYNNGQYGEAIPILERHLRLNRANLSAQLSLLYCYYMKSDWSNTLTSAQRALALDPNQSSALEYEAAAFNALGRYQEAIAPGERATLLEPEHGTAFAQLAQSNLKTGHFDAALKAAERHIALHQTEPYAFEQKAAILDAMNRHDEAYVAREVAADLRPQE
jgi:hypothetical protein